MEAIPRTMDEARKGVAKLYLEYLNLRREYGLTDGVRGGHILEGEKFESQDGSPIELTDDQKIKIKRIKGKRKEYNESLYSIPWLRKKMRAWMVDIKFGDENIFGKKCCDDADELRGQEDLEKDLELLIENPSAFTEKSGGTLMKQVADFLNNHGFSITDRGGGPSGGHIGCPCTDAECELLLTLTNIQFKKAIDAGLIFPQIAWFSPNLPGFNNDIGIKDWISKTGFDGEDK